MARRIYHGTKEDRLQRILDCGIEPRGSSNGNWDKFASHPDMVYLSVAYPLYFALNAEGSGRLVVLEIDMDELEAEKELLYPDEDFISHALRHQKKLGDKTFEEVHMDVRDNIDSYQHHWKDSLEGLGNCSFRGTINPDIITRYCIFDPDARSSIAMMALDPVISILNFMICQKKYTGLVAWMFGDRDTIPSQHEAFGANTETLPLEQSDLMMQQEEYWNKQSRDRTGIEVHTRFPII